MTPRQAQQTLKKLGDKLPRDHERSRYELHDGREVEVWVSERAGVSCLNVRALGGMGLILLPDSVEQVALLVGRK